MKRVTRINAFTLIEVLLALLLFSVGFFALFGLFPKALQQNKRSMDVTRVSLFAETVVAGVQANALTVPDWDKWTNRGSLQALLVADLWPEIIMDGSTNNVPFTNAVNTTWLRYTIRFSGSNTNLLQTMGLYVDIGTNGPFQDDLYVFPIGVFYMGKP
jgi:prepilin-type N-terminal cleavage/methylation domain-containing protein